MAEAKRLNGWRRKLRKGESDWAQSRWTEVNLGLLVFDKVSDVIITNPHVQLSVFRTVVLYPQTAKMPISKQWRFRSFSPWTWGNVVSDHKRWVYSKGLGKSCSCYILLSVATCDNPIRALWCAVLWKHNKLFQQLLCCSLLHGITCKVKCGSFFFFFSTTSAHMLVITSASLNFRHNVLIVCMLLFSLK